MYSDANELPKLKAEFTFGKFVFILVSIFLFIILPINIINTYVPQLNPSGSESQDNFEVSTGRVAGADSQQDIVTTGNDLTIPFINVAIDLDSQSGSLILMGIVLLGISIILSIYLLVDSTKKNS